MSKSKVLDLDFLSMPLKVQYKIFLYKMSKLYGKEIEIKDYYSRDRNIENGLFGFSQLFSIRGKSYLYKPSPLGYPFYRVAAIYERLGTTFLILWNIDKKYRLQVDNFMLYKSFDTFDQAKDYIDFYLDVK